MPARDSRYSRVSDLRLLPDVRGDFQHTLVEGERLDHLASAYYRDPRRWWRICDANPEFLSPLDLVGAGPLRTLRVELRAGVALGPLAATLRREPGVARVGFAADPASDRVAALVTYNRVLLDEEAVLALLGSARDRSQPPQAPGRAGKQITVPPDSVR